MSRRHCNLLALTAILIILVPACVYRSSRDSKPSATSATPAKSPNATLTKGRQKDGGENADGGDFIVERSAVKNARYQEIDRQVREEKLLEKAADKLNRSLVLPKDIRLKTKDCGEVNAFYDADTQSVTVCYELMEHFYKVFRGDGLNEEKAYDKMFDAVRFAFLHEIGHALVDVYNLPITGNEEDAADRCAAFISLTELGEDGVSAVLAAADSFAIESKNDGNSKRSYADEHLLHEQRFYNSLCMLYGSDREKYAYLAEENYLPPERAARCPQEYERTVESWSNLLAPWRKS